MRHRATLVMLYVFNSLKATGSLESLDYEMDWTHVYLFLFSAHLYNSIRNDYYYYLFFAIISWYTAFLFHNIQYTLQAYIQNSGKSLFIMLCVIYYFFRMKKLIILLLDFYMCHCKLNHYRSSPSKPTMP